MTAQEIIDYLRRDVLRDSAAPFLWSDDLLLMYLNDAYMRVCRDAGVFVDDESYSVALLPGVYSYDLPTTILLVKSAKLLSTGLDLTNYTRRSMPTPSTTELGVPTVFALNEATMRMRVYPTPVAADEILLRVAAELPLLLATDTPRIAPRHHLGLADWVAFRCMTNNDAETLNNPAAEKHKQNFAEYVGVVKRDVYRFAMGENPFAVQNWTGKR